MSIQIYVCTIVCLCRCFLAIHACVRAYVYACVQECMCAHNHRNARLHVCKYIVILCRWHCWLDAHADIGLHIRVQTTCWLMAFQMCIHTCTHIVFSTSHPCMHVSMYELVMHGKTLVFDPYVALISWPYVRMNACLCSCSEALVLDHVRTYIHTYVDACTLCALFPKLNGQSIKAQAYGIS